MLNAKSRLTKRLLSQFLGIVALVLACTEASLHANTLAGFIAPDVKEVRAREKSNVMESGMITVRCNIICFDAAQDEDTHGLISPQSRKGCFHETRSP